MLLQSIHLSRESYGGQNTMKKILFTFNQFVLVCLVLVGMMQVNGLLAQGTSGTILGVVQDASEAVLPGVTVMATNLETNQSRTAISDDEGRYRLAQLPPGNYEVQSELSGFNTQIRGPIALTVGPRLWWTSVWE